MAKTKTPISVCAWCGAVQSPAPCEEEVASIRADLLEDERGEPLVTHTICPSCADEVLKAA
jgi:hypothetical protein